MGIKFKTILPDNNVFELCKLACHPGVALSCHSKIIYVMADLLTAFWDVFDGENHASFWPQGPKSSDLKNTLLKENKFFWQHRLPVCVQTVMTLSSKSSSSLSNPSESWEKNSKIWSVKSLLGSSWPSSYPSEWLKHPWLKTQIGFHIFSA